MLHKCLVVIGMPLCLIAVSAGVTLFLIALAKGHKPDYSRVKEVGIFHFIAGLIFILVGFVVILAEFIAFFG